MQRARTGIELVRPRASTYKQFDEERSSTVDASSQSPRGIARAGSPRKRPPALSIAQNVRLWLIGALSYELGVVLDARQCAVDATQLSLLHVQRGDGGLPSVTLSGLSW